MKIFKYNNGLLPIELADVPFEVKRVFVVHGYQNEKRGNHAHRSCKQFLVCVRGCLQVTTEDLSGKKDCAIMTPGFGFFLDTYTWATVVYCVADTILLAFCSENYNKEEYIYDYEEFEKMKEEKKNG